MFYLIVSDLEDSVVTNYISIDLNMIEFRTLTNYKCLSRTTALTLSLPTTSILVVSWRHLFANYDYTRS